MNELLKLIRIVPHDPLRILTLTLDLRDDIAF